MDASALDTNDLTELRERLFSLGLVIAPIRPTKEMIDAGWASATDENAELVWRDMIELVISSNQ